MKGPHGDVVTVAPEHDLVPRFDAELVAQVLGDDDLPLRANLVSHTVKYNHLETGCQGVENGRFRSRTKRHPARAVRVAAICSVDQSAATGGTPRWLCTAVTVPRSRFRGVRQGGGWRQSVGLNVEEDVMSSAVLALPRDTSDVTTWAAVAFVSSYSSAATRQAYTTQLRLWFAWCQRHQLDPLGDVRRPHVELYARELEARGLAPATIALKLVAITGFYRYCVEEQLLEHSPAVRVRCPKIAQESTRLGLDRNELGAFLVQAGLSGGNDHVLACLLGLNAYGCPKRAVRTCPISRSPTGIGCCGSSGRATSPH